ncbi:MAG: serine/threonine-protein phosphatase [Rhodoglobus sp.]|nr:serine/threonine-protein phosphatase [Rhodoglobus sp.]
MGAIRDYAWDLPYARVTFEVSSASDKGLVRRVNEDSLVAVPPLFLVADGMGGHAFGDRASQETARVLGSLLPGDEPARASAILDAVAEANRAVKAISEDEFAGTTLAGVALVQADAGQACHWMAFNIGDSRIYSWDGVVLRQVSVDHSAVQELVDEGVITAAEAAVHPDRNVITRAIGIDGELEPDVWLLPAGGTQTFVICSDGLTKELDDRAIEAVLSSVAADLSPADRLVAAALASGGADNVTVVVVESTVSLSGSAEGSSADKLPAHLEETLPRP